ncbi:MAG: hypothetical protein FD145_564 [Candidatus Saganbacteria bacterium]|uniref:Thioester reductase (TE) domain-containing protein n=1 Tax=Candidatus Saganbacteria bacterium TaxID=2575572 RepID=A0A833L1M1_UNCSA|nr:MAG: hypothetical protein FD145_564 [Candidatus Saganbacteria bacterium]
MKILLTGATGFVGSNILEFLVENHEVDEIYLILRSTSEQNASSRFQDMVAASNTIARHYNKVKLFNGDLSVRNFGLKENEYKFLTQQTNIVIHAAASTQFDLELTEAMKINFDGTKHILDFSEACKEFKHLFYISTAYIVGNYPQVFKESDYNVNQKFENSYEETKYLAEGEVRRGISSLHSTIIRPSILIGDSQTGKVQGFKVLYPFIKLIAQKALSIIPCQSEACLNLVPIDYFNLIFSILFKYQLSKNKPSHLNISTSTFHVINNQNAMIKDLIEYGCPILNIEAPLLVDPEKLPPQRRRVIKRMFNHYFPYLNRPHLFDNSNTLKVAQHQCPIIGKDIIKNMLNYCCEVGYLNKHR